MIPPSPILQATPLALKKDHKLLDRIDRLLVVLVIYLSFQSNVWSCGISSFPEIKITDCKIFNLFFDLWKASRFVKVSLSFERAAWIQYNVKNGYEFLWWPEPSTMTLEYVPSIRWKGKVPSNVIALAHTHPKNPKPSQKDTLVAKKLNIPIYTISQRGIWKVAADGTLTMVANQHWYDRNHSPFSACKNGLRLNQSRRLY
jgi:hypothetical protein